MVLRNDQLKIGSVVWQREEDQRKGFQYCLNPISFNDFLYFRAIQGHSGDNAVDPELRDNVLLPEGFTEYIYHFVNCMQ